MASDQDADVKQQGRVPGWLNLARIDIKEGGGKINSFGRGLELLGVLTLIRTHWAKMKEFFVFNHEKHQLTASKFIHLIGSNPPTKEQELQAYEWFLEYRKLLVC